MALAESSVVLLHVHELGLKFLLHPVGPLAGSVSQTTCAIQAVFGLTNLGAEVLYGGAELVDCSLLVPVFVALLDFGAHLNGTRSSGVVKCVQGFVHVEISRCYAGYHERDGVSAQ